MIHRVSLPLRQQLTSLRVCSVEQDDGSIESTQAKWLIDLQAQAQRCDSERRTSQRCIEVISEALGQVSTQVDANLVSITALATELGLSLAREIVGIAIDREILDPTATVLRTLASVTIAPQDASLSIYLSAADFSNVVADLQRHPEFAPMASQTEFLIDANLGQGSVRIETGAGKLRYEPQEVLKLLCEEIRRESSS